MMRALLSPLRFWRGAVLGGLLLAVSACERNATPVAHVPETEDPAYKQAQSMWREGNAKGALEKFLQVIDVRPGNAPESQLEAGRIYLQEKMPVEAIYHFKQFLRIRPGSEQTRQVEDLIVTAQKQFLQSVPGRPFGAEPARSDLDEKYREIRQENDRLKRQNIELEQRLVSLARTPPTLISSNAAPAETVEPIALQQARPPQPERAVQTPIPATYTVEKGDTLTKISTKIYGTSARWRDIYNANRQQLRSESSLQIGMVLTIPR